MPKLYYTPTSCGAASFIVAHSESLENVADVEVVDLGILRAHQSTAQRAEGARAHGNKPG